MWLKNLNVPPRKTDEVRLKIGHGVSDGPAPLGNRMERKIKNALTDFRLPPVNKICQIGDTDRVDLFAGKEDVENRVHAGPASVANVE